MNNKDIEKNILDLRYQEELQKLNATLVAISVGVLSFVGTFIWNHEFLGLGIVISIVIVIFGFLIYWRIKNKMRCILEEINKLKV